MSKSFSKSTKSILSGVSVFSILVGLIQPAEGIINTTRYVNTNIDMSNTSDFSPPGFNSGDNIRFNGAYTVTFSTPGIPDVDTINFGCYDGNIVVSSGIDITADTVTAWSWGGPVGNISFLGDSNANITNVGNSKQRINTISLGNGTVSFNGQTLYGKEIDLTTGSTLDFSGWNSSTWNFTNGIKNISGNNFTGDVGIDTDFTFRGPMGTSGAALHNVMFLDDNALTFVNNDGDFIQAQGITIDPNLPSGSGSLLAFYHGPGGAKDINTDIGSPNHKLKLFAVSTDPSYEEGGCANIVTNVKTGTNIYADRIDLFPYNLNEYRLGQSTLNIETNVIIDGLIAVSSPYHSNFGIVNVQGSATLNGGIGESDNYLSQVHFTSSNPNDIVTLNGDIYARTITQIGNHIVLQKDTTFATFNDFSYEVINGTQSLGLNTLTIIGGGFMGGTDTMNLTINEAGQFGKIVSDGGNFNMQTVEDVTTLVVLNINLSDETLTIPDGGIKTYQILSGINDGTIALPDDSIVTLDVVSSSNPFVSWSYSQGVITETVIPAVGGALIRAANVTDETDLANLGIIAGSDNAVRNNDLVASIANGTTTNLLNGLVTATTEVTEDSFDILEDTNDAVSVNLTQKTSGIDVNFVSNDAYQGISAGDAAERYGAWFNYSLSSNSQGERKGKPGYKSKSNAVTLGVDTLITDETAVGIAIGYIDTKVNHKNANDGKISKVKSALISLYSITELFNNWYVQAQAIFGRSKIKNWEPRSTGTGIEIARANFKSNAYSAAIETGYHYLTENKILITPHVGVEYDVIDKSAYQEYGTTNQNLTVRKGAQKKLFGHTGVAFAKGFSIKEHLFEGEIFGRINHDFLNKNLNVNFKLQGIDNSLITRTTQNAPTFYTLGFKISSKVKNTDITLGYDTYFADKYRSHQGSIKLRVDF